MSNFSSYDIKLLVIKIAEGNDSAFRTIFDYYKTPFFSAAFRMTRSAAIAEEIVQEVFIAIWNRRGKVAASRNPERYLRRMLYNSIYAHFRKLLLERRLKKNLYQLAEPQVDEIEEVLFAKEHSTMLNSLIDRLPPQQQQVYRLSKQDGLSRQEVAATLGISPNTVRNHLAAAVEFIAAGLKKSTSILIWIAIFKIL